MPPRFAYWTIILEGKPTAFRAQHRDDLLPTFKQLQGKHPDIVMKWFARGRLWESPAEAQSALRQRERRPREWRPGGEHRDPRARFDVPRDEKRRRFGAKKRRDLRDRVAPQSDARSRPDNRERNEQQRPGAGRSSTRPAWQRDRDRRPPHAAGKQQGEGPRSREPSGHTQGARGPGRPHSGLRQRNAKHKPPGGRGGGGTGGSQPA